MNREIILQEWLHSVRDVRFEWGENDCALFAANWVKFYTKNDPAIMYRGEYSTQLGAARIIGSGRTVENIADEELCGRVHPNYASRGDIISTIGEDGLPALGVCVDETAIVLTKEGPRYIHRDLWLNAWRIE